MDETAALLGLWQDKSRASADVKAIATNHIAELERKIVELQEMADTLKHLAHCCSGDDRPNCPILTQLADGEVPV